MRWVVAALLSALALAGCGGDGDDETSRPITSTTSAATTTTAARPKGPVVRICNRALAEAAAGALRDQGFRGRLGVKPVASGTPRLSVCELAGGDAEVSVSLDRASDAVRRYRNRVTETAQFSGGDPEHAPHTVKGVGDPRLGGAGANWLPRIHLLLSARGDRVLIVDVSADDLEDDALREAAIAISLDAWTRLER